MLIIRRRLFYIVKYEEILNCCLCEVNSNNLIARMKWTKGFR